MSTAKSEQKKPILETNHPHIEVILSREYSSSFETGLIPKILKRIVREATKDTT